MSDRSIATAALAASLLFVLAGPAGAQNAAIPLKPSAPTTMPAKPSTPAAAPSTSPAREPTAGQMAARDRQKKCGAEWRDAKAAGKTAGTKWPQFWSKCNARLKGNAA